MAESISYSKARAEFDRLLNKVAEDRSVVYITRRNKPDVAMISTDELSSLLETAHLLRSPENARRLLRALSRALSKEGSHSSLDELKRDLSLEK